MNLLDKLKLDFRKMQDYRKAVGYATATYETMVMPFIEFCGNNYTDSFGIIKEMIVR